MEQFATSYVCTFTVKFYRPSERSEKKKRMFQSDQTFDILKQRNKIADKFLASFGLNSFIRFLNVLSTLAETGSQRQENERKEMNNLSASVLYILGTTFRLIRSLDSISTRLAFFVLLNELLTSVEMIFTATKLK